jgi:hypothetical protein
MFRELQWPADSCIRPRVPEYGKNISDLRVDADDKGLEAALEWKVLSIEPVRY